MESQQGEARPDHELAGALLALLEPEIPAMADGEVVVKESHDGQGDHGREHGGTRGFEAPDPEVRHAVSDEGAPDDGDAAHGRCARLRVVAFRSVLPDELADPPVLEIPDQDGRADQRHDERRRRREKQSDHGVRAPASVSVSAARGGGPPS